MSGGDSVLEEEELEFLLHNADVVSPQEEVEPTEDEATNVTIRGDLGNIGLADIFQTLSMSKMRGILKVYNPLETRLIYFDGEGIRLMYPARSETRRIGQRLVRCGLVSTAQLRKALIAQKKSYQPLGEILVERDYVTEDGLESVLNHQLEEDLHGIFTWHSGNFEFYKNKPEDSFILEQLKRTPAFEINGFLLEAARRADEWGQILQVLGSVHAVPVLADPPGDLSGDQAIVAEAIDEHATVSELSELTMLGLFNCSRAICDLEREGFVEFAEPSALIELAREASQKGELKRALQLAHNMQQWAAELESSHCTALAEVLEQCGEPRLGASILVACAEYLPDPEFRIEIAKRALNLDRSSTQVLEFLRTEYAAQDRTGDDDYQNVLIQLSEALAEDGAFDRALEVFEGLSADAQDDPSRLLWKATLLQKAGRRDEALPMLIELRESFEEEGDPKRLAKLYEQILRIDSHQRDVAKALRELRLGKTKARLRKVYVLTTVAVLGLVGWFILDWVETGRSVDQAAIEIRGKLDELDVEGAQQLIAQATATLGARQIWLDLEDEVAATLEKIENTRLTARNADYQQAINKASEQIEQSSLSAAMAIYQELLKDKEAARLVRKVAKGQLSSITVRLEKALDALKFRLPGPPEPLASHESLLETKKLLEARVATDTTLARNLLAMAEDKTLKSLWAEAEMGHALQMSGEILEAANQVGELYALFVSKVERNEKNLRLEPFFEQAQKAELEYDFETAHRLYKMLHAELSDRKELEPTFRDKVNKYASILRQLALLDAATKKPDFLGARTYYRHLKTSYGEYPWGELVSLPIQVVTTPVGADVLLNGESMGTSPCVLPIRPSDQNRIEVHLDGFRSEQTTITGDDVGQVMSILTLVPEATYEFAGAVNRAPVVAEDGSVFLVDRSGAVSRWSPETGRTLWRESTHDMSGLLTRPLVWKNSVLVASFDGNLRAFDKETGDPLWELEGYACESTPVIFESTLVAATRTQKLVFIDLDSRTRKTAIDLEFRVSQDLILLGKSVLVVGNSGTVRAIDINRGTDLWKPLDLGRGNVCPPLVVGSTGVFSSDSGVVSAYDLGSGKRRWNHRGYGDLRWGPVHGGEFAYVAAPPTLNGPAKMLTFDLETGEPGPEYALPPAELWSTAPASIDDKVLAGTRSGLAWVFDAATLELQFWIRGNGPVGTKPVVVAGQRVICTFDDRGIQVFEELR